MNKSYRQGQILKLIGQKRVTTQQQLARELKALGIQATQVTLSRDIRELGLVKTPSGYHRVGSPRPGPELSTLAGEFLLDIRVAQHIVVLKTSPGTANSLAAALDAAGWEDVVGTLAGDDTILVIAPDKRTALAIRDRLLEFL